MLAPRRAAFEARSFELDVLSCEGAYCGAHGHLRGTHAGCYLGAWPKAGGRAEVRMRVGLHWHVVDGVARTGYMMHDAPALFADHFDTDLLARAASAAAAPACPIATTAVALMPSTSRPPSPRTPRWSSGSASSASLPPASTRRGRATGCRPCGRRCCAPTSERGSSFDFCCFCSD